MPVLTNSIHSRLSSDTGFFFHFFLAPTPLILQILVERRFNGLLAPPLSPAG